MIAKVHTTNEMADDIEEILVWGEDFEAILAMMLVTSYHIMNNTF